MNNTCGNEVLTEWYEKTYSSVYALIFSIVKNEFDACDLTQEAYISAFENVDKLNDVNKFDKWIIQIAANKCKDFLRKKKPDLFSQMGEEDENFEDDILDDSNTYNPEIVTESREKREIVRRILDSLPEDQQLCVELFYGKDMKISEIAQTLGISENTVKSRLSYAKKKMKEQIEELESKGEKLHGLTAIALLPLIKQLLASQSFATPPAAMLPASEVVKNMVKGASVAKKAAAASNVAAKAVASASKNLAIKIVSAVVATAVVAGVTVAVLEPELFSSQNDTSISAGVGQNLNSQSTAGYDFFKNVTVEFVGFDKNGEMEMSVEDDLDNEWHEYLVFEAEEHGPLSNGDTVRITARMEGYDESGLSLSERYLFKTTQTKEFVVTGLKTLVTKKELQTKYADALKGLKAESIEKIGRGYNISDIFVYYGESKGDAEYENCIFCVVNYNDTVLYVNWQTTYCEYNCYIDEKDGERYIDSEKSGVGWNFRYNSDHEQILENLKEKYTDYDIEFLKAFEI